MGCGLGVPVGFHGTTQAETLAIRSVWFLISELICIWGRFHCFFLEYKAGSRIWNRLLVCKFWIFDKGIAPSCCREYLLQNSWTFGAFPPIFMSHPLKTFPWLPFPPYSAKVNAVSHKVWIRDFSKPLSVNILSFKYWFLWLDYSLPSDRIHVWLVFLQIGLSIILLSRRVVG